jgi:hypothetical protein
MRWPPIVAGNPAGIRYLLYGTLIYATVAAVAAAIKIGGLMKVSVGLVACVLILPPGLTLADSPFDGTWKGDLSTAKVAGKPDSFLLQDGTYSCKTCSPVVKVAADGKDHAVSGTPYYDTLNVAVLDERTILKTAKKSGRTVLTTKFSVSADGGSATSEFNDATATNGAPVTGTFAWKRVTSGPPGSHASSGSWQQGQAKISDNGVTSTLKVTNNVLSMTAPTGSSYAAKLDGTDAPYSGDPGVTSVSVREIDARSFEETDKRDGKAVMVWRWHFAADGKTATVHMKDVETGAVLEALARKQ